uniref:Uncharacterized protein n=1 Tax=Terrapene triunguis TaxID=2587831 RepID=A0A674IME2_9SAUR
MAHWGDPVCTCHPRDLSHPQIPAGPPQSARAPPLPSSGLPHILPNELLCLHATASPTLSVPHSSLFCFQPPQAPPVLPAPPNSPRAPSPASSPMLPAPLSSPLSWQSWWVLVSQTEGLSQILRRHAEDLAAGPLNKLTLLIRDKQQLRKAYSEQWQQLNQDYVRVGRAPCPTSYAPHTECLCHSQTSQQELEKLKSQYRSLARDSAQAKRKFQEASKGGCPAPPLPHAAPSLSWGE